MSVDPDLLHEEFNELADRVGPSHRIDIERAVTDARRTLARRRRTRGGAALSATALAVAVAVLFAGGLPGRRDAAAPSATSTASAPFPRTAHDPVAVGLSLGWLPSGLYAHIPSWPSPTNVLKSYLMAEADSEAVPHAPKPMISGSEITEPRLTLYTTPSGAMPHPLVWQSSTQESDVAGPLIGGSPSWIEAQRFGYYGPEGLGALVWKLSDGDWAVLTFIDNTDHGQGSGIFNRANVVRIAQSVTQTPDPVALPLRITGALARAEVTAVQSSSTNGTNLFQPSYWLILTFREAGAEIELTLRAGEELSALSGQACTSATTQASLSLMACVDVHGTLPPALASSGPRGLLEDVEILDSTTTTVIQ